MATVVESPVAMGEVGDETTDYPSYYPSPGIAPLQITEGRDETAPE
jgi:hypothetical protein